MTLVCPRFRVRRQTKCDVPSLTLHQQDGEYFCSVASAQMLLHQMGYDLTDPAIAQEDLFTEARANQCDAGWDGSDPCGLAYILNTCQPAANKYKFTCYQSNISFAIERRIVWTIQETRVAPAVLVWGNLHWLLVTGFQASKRPAAADDDSYEILGFMVNNPAPQLVRLTSDEDVPLYPEHHQDEKDACGHGWIEAKDTNGAVLYDYDHNPILVDRGTVGHHISYTSWHCEYMDGPVQITGKFEGDYVAVCADDGNSSLCSTPQPGACPDPRINTISDDEARCAAIEGLKKAKLDSRDLWKPVMSPPDPEPPILVYKDDKVTPYYFLVRMKTTDGIVPVTRPVTVRVDAYSPTYLESWAVPESSTLATPPIDVSIVKRMIDKGETVTLEDGTQITLNPIDFAPGPVPVWRACLQSFSAANPFYVIQGPVSDIFIRASDGVAFTSLNSDIAGA